MIKTIPHSLQLLLLAAVTLAIHCNATSSNNTDCTLWANNSMQSVTVGTNSVVHMANCFLSNVGITVFSAPFSTLVIDSWSMVGGSVTIQGLASAQGSLSDIAVYVIDSSIAAVGGPAVGLVIGANYGSPPSPAPPIVVTNVTLWCSGSSLSSIATTKAINFATGI